MTAKMDTVQSDKMLRPMLASPVEDLEALSFPLIASPKIDGIRCLIVNGKALTRKLLPIPNKHIRETLESLSIDGYDGELYIEGADYNTIQSAVMSQEGCPSFTYLVFDNHERGMQTYSSWLTEDIQDVGPVKLLPHRIINSLSNLYDYENECLNKGHEGVMLRTPDSPYKFGRSTFKQGYLLKLKKFEDSEATIIGFNELLLNKNELEKDNLGHAKRSKSKDRLVPAGRLGSFVCRTKVGVEFNLFSGLTLEQQISYWNDRDKLIGKLVKYKFFEVSKMGVPRFPIFLGFRSEIDT